jgi:hypothetical protein
MAQSKPVYSNDRTRFVRMGLVILEELTPMLHDVLQHQVVPNRIYSEITGQLKHQKPKDKKFLKLGVDQQTLIQNAQNDGYREFDITLSYTLLRNLKCVNVRAPTQGWGTSQMPGNGETTLGDDIERIRLIRNKIWGHAAAPSLSKAEFQDLWSVIAAICNRMQIKLKNGKDYVQRLKQTEERAIYEEMEKSYIDEIRILKGKYSLKHI